MKINRKTEGEKKPRRSFGALPVGRSLAALADVRGLLAVFAVVLVAMGIFAWAFRQIHVGYVEENGAVVSSTELYDRLNRGKGDMEEIELTSVRGNDEIFSRGGKYYVGKDMIEYRSEYPIYSNDGQSLYFVNSDSSLVTEDFELLDTYAGMFVADGTSFNAGREQADIETIYFVKLKNGLYENALPVTLSRYGAVKTMPVNCVIHFADDGIRYFDEKGGRMIYGEQADVDGLTVQIGDKTWSYEEFLSMLGSAGKSEVTSSSSSQGSSQQQEPEEPEADETEQVEGGQTVPAQQVDTIHQDNAKDDTAKDKQNAERKDQNVSAAGSTGGSAGSQSGSSSSSSSSSGGKDSGKGNGNDDASKGTSSGASQAKPGTDASTEAPYQKPSVTVKGINTRTYSLDIDLDIKDEGGYLKKVTTRVLWRSGEQRRSVKESGEYTINNLPAGTKDMVLVVEMKYRNTQGEYVTEEVYRTTVSTMTIEDGTNTLYLDYLPDTWDGVNNDSGYAQIYPDQIEIRNLSVREGNDSKIDDSTSTMDYVRYFRISVYEVGKTEPAATWLLSNADKKKMLIVPDEDKDEEKEEGTGDDSDNSGEEGSDTPAQEQGLDWISDKTIAVLDSATDYYYEFELLDRNSESLKVVYENGANDESRYDNDGNLLTGENSDRKAYTCKQHPTGKLTMGTASYDSQKINAVLKNPNQSTVTDLYLTVQDSYGRYIRHSLEKGNIKGTIGDGILTDDSRYMLMNGVKNEAGDEIPIYDGITGAENAPYDQTREEQSWEKLSVPSFANSVYTVRLEISYDIGDRTGIYTKTLATRSNCKTTSLNTLGNVSFNRVAGDLASDKVNYSYAASDISAKLLPLMYRFEYDLKNTTPGSSDVPMKFQVSAEYEEMDGKEDQGVLLTIPGQSKKLRANDWSFNYSYSYREKSDAQRTIHLVTGHLSWDEATQTVTRTVEEDGILQTTIQTSGKTLYEAYAAALDLDTCAKVLGKNIQENTIVVESTTSVTLDFDQKDEQGNIRNINKDYSIGISAANLKNAFTEIQSESDQDFSDVIMKALSNGATLTMKVGSLKSNQIYQADARAYAYQSGAIEAGEDRKPQITLVTTTDSTLSLPTLKGEPKVSMELFTTSTELRLFDFYVLDEDGAVQAKKDGGTPYVTVSLYQYDEDSSTGEVTEKLVARKTEIPVAKTESEAGKQTLVFSGLTNGQKYRIKVTADVYDVTPDESNKQYDQLIGEKMGDTDGQWKDNGIWEDTVGMAVQTGITLEEVLNEDPDMLMNQLIDFSTEEVEGSGWEVGTVDNATGTVTRNASYRTTPYMDLRTRNEDGTMNPVQNTDIFIAKGIDNYNVYYYDADKNYLGSMNQYTTFTAGDTSERWYVVRMPEGSFNGTNKGDYKVEDIAYARVTINHSYSDLAFFGRLNKEYLTRKSENPDGYNDVLGSLAESGDHWKELVSGGTESNQTFNGTKLTDNLYKNQISVEGGQIVQLISNSATGTADRDLVFLDGSGNVILNVSEDGTSTSPYRRIHSNSLVVVPKAAKKMLVQKLNIDDQYQGRLYILTDTKWSEQYNKWRNDIQQVSTLTGSTTEALSVARNKSIDGGKYVTPGNNGIEATSRIRVEEGDLWLINLNGWKIIYYDENNNYISECWGPSQNQDYIIIPEGVRYVSLVNARWSGTDIRYDRSLLNGKTYNQNGSYVIPFLYCGNLSAAHKSQLQNGGTAGKSNSQMYANLRVQLKDGEQNYLTNSSYLLEVHKVAYNGTEISDEELMEAREQKMRETTIKVSDNKAEEVNRCVTIPVENGYSYKVILCAKVGSRDSVELGSVYFTVQASGDPVYGISSAFQLVGIRQKPYGDYVLNQDVTLTNDYGANAGTLYGTLDLQGHTVTNSRIGNLFDNIGSAAKKQGGIRNGTIQTKGFRTTGDIRIAGTNYGTLENLNFKVDTENPYSISGGGVKTYDNSRWNSETNAYMISQNRGTLQNFTLEYVSDLVSCYRTGFIDENYGMIQNGYIYGDGAVVGGTYVGGVTDINNTGTVRNIYSTINSKSNNTALGGNIRTTYANGTVVGDNRGKVENVLATGNVYKFNTTYKNNNYEFGGETFYTDRGCAVGVTTGKMDTTNCYYATVGSSKRVTYDKNSYNTRVEAGMLADTDWWRDLFKNSATQTDSKGLLEDNLEEMIGDDYYPWVDMGNAREKYSILQPYLTMDVSSAAGFDLMKSEVLDYVYNDQGFASANVKLTFMNGAGYTITNILLDGAEFTIERQKDNEDTGFYEVTGTLKVAAQNGRYQSGYNVTTVYYKRNATANPVAARYSSDSSAGERIIDAEFFYPLKNTQEWTEYFTSERKDWNFRIWGDDVWDFAEPYMAVTSSGTTVSKYPSAVKTFEYSGHLDGTLYVPSKEDSKIYVPAVDENGQVKTHELKNMFDYNIRYNSNGSFKQYELSAGYVFSKMSGTLSNLTVRDLSIGILRPVHEEKVSKMPDSSLSGKEVTFQGQPMKQLILPGGNQGLVSGLGENGIMENVHLLGGFIGGLRNGDQNVGGLAGYAENSTTIRQCSVSGLTIRTSEQAASLRAGGLVGYSFSYVLFKDCYAADLDLQAQASTNKNFSSEGIGGIVGWANYSNNVLNCYSSGTITSEGMNTGGLIGYISGTSSVTGCYSAMNMSLSSTSGAGLVARNNETLTISDCLYTGSLGVASTSDTTHFILGRNTSNASLSNCYVYQPHLEADSSLLDAGAELITYDELTAEGADFYQKLFGDAYTYAWNLGGQPVGTTSAQGAYLPALKVDASIMLGQVDGTVCHVPKLAEEVLEIRDVWAFATEDRGEKIHEVSGGIVDAGTWYDSTQTQLDYTPNDVEFTLVLGCGELPASTVTSIEVDGLTTGGLDSEINYNNHVTDYQGFSKEMLKARTYRLDIERADTEDEDLFAYRIKLLGTEVNAYRDIYTLTVTLDNGAVLKKNFQFCNSEGTLEPKYLSISNAYEWNLYFGTDGNIPELAKKAAEKPEGQRDDAEKVLAVYKDRTYQGYAAASYNIEITGTIDFDELYKIKEEPVINVLANNLRGKAGNSGTGSIGLIEHLNVEKATSSTKGLFRSVGGSVSNMRFENNTIRWSSRAGSISGLLAQVSGGMNNCSFTNTVLTGGANNFGIMGTCEGTVDTVTVINAYVESSSDAEWGSQFVGGLAGALRGDLKNVTAYGDDSSKYYDKDYTGERGYQVAGNIYTGGIVGYLYSTDHEVNGHSIIGGADYTTTLAEGDTRVDLNPEGWYSKLRASDKDYMAGNAGSPTDEYMYDSLSRNYAVVSNIYMKDISVISAERHAGGLAGDVYHMKASMGSGYCLTDGVTAINISVQAHNRAGAGEIDVGGIYGYMIGMVHDVKLTNMSVEGNGSCIGGFCGYNNSRYDYDNSAYGSGTDRIGHFTTVFDEVTVTDSTVRGLGYVGGVSGHMPYYTNLHNITGEGNVILGEGDRVGGLFGHIGNPYMSDITVRDTQVYNSGSTSSSSRYVSKYTGGIGGYIGGYGSRRITAINVQVLASGQSSYVGGLFGHGSTMRDTAGGTRPADGQTGNVAADIYVYGNTCVGGLYGEGSWIKYIDVNQENESLGLTGDETIRVVGTGDYVGGVAGTYDSTMSACNIQNVTVNGGGMSTGGVFGRRTGGSINNCEIRHVSVTGSGSGAAAGKAYIGNDEKGDFQNGSCVGGMSGSERYSDTNYTTFQDISVYGSSDYVGGLVGLKSQNRLYEVDAEQIRVYSAGTQYVGGIFGYISSTSTNARIITDDVTVNAPSATGYVGGGAGYINSTSGTQGGISESLLKVTVEANTAKNYVGGLAGYVANIEQMNMNVVEATVKAPTATYVAGGIGYLGRQSGNFYMRYNQIVADVTGKDYVGGMIAYSGTYQPIGTNGSVWTIFDDLVAAKLKTINADGKAAYFYSYMDGGTLRKDISRGSSTLPYALRVWDGSSITTGSNQVSVKDQTFMLDDMKTERVHGYWYDNSSDNVPTKTEDRNRICLVTTDQLKNRRFYNGGNANLGLTMYADKVEQNKVTFSSNLEELSAASTVSNPYGLYEDMTTSWTEDETTVDRNYLYLPAPLNPLLLNRSVAVNVSNTDRYTPYYIGKATFVDGGQTMTFEITGGVSVPGTYGSILTGENNNTAGDPLANITLKTAPRVYAANAYTLNVEFSDNDVYAGAYIEVYKATDDSIEADNADVTGTETTETPIYSVQATEGSISYSMLYDFSTPLVIRIANGDYNNANRQVVATIQVNGEKLRKRTCMLNQNIYVIGNDGQIYLYTKTWSQATKLQNYLDPGEKAVNMVLSNSTEISVLTDKNRIVYLTGSNNNTGKYLNCIVGDPNESSNLSDTEPAGSQSGSDGTGTDGTDQTGSNITSGDIIVARAASASSQNGTDNTTVTERNVAKATAPSDLQVAGADNKTTGTGAQVAEVTRSVDNTQYLGAGKMKKVQMQIAAAENQESSAADKTTAGDNSTGNTNSGSTNAGDTTTGNTSSGSATDNASTGSTTEDGAAGNSNTGNTSTGSTTDGTTSGSITTDSATTDSTSNTTAGADASSEIGAGDAANDISAGETGAADATTGDDTNVAEMPGDTVLDESSDVEFDDSLLDAEPLFEFDYKDYHICTYLTYSLIFDGDQVTVRNMQLFVKNGQLFALNAPDEIVPGSVLIDNYQGHAYMTVVTKDGKMVDLMDELNYPEDFKNYDIKNISNNLYSDLTYVEVEYEDGTIEMFNYLTGAVVYVEEGDGDGTGGDVDFLSYIMGFFRNKWDTAYAEVSNAYQNAVKMQDYLSTQTWKDWFTKDGTANGDGEEGYTSLTQKDTGSKDGAQDVASAEASNESQLGALQPETSTDGTGAGEGQENDAIIGEDLNGDTSESTTGAAGKDGETGSDIAGGTTEEGQDGITAAGADGTGGGLIGGAAQGESDGTLATGATGDGIGGAASNEMASEGSQTEGQAQASNSDGMQAAPLEGGAVSDEALQADASTKDENAETVAGGTAPEVESEASDGTEDTSEVAVTVPTENGFDDELIIAYDADSKGYAVYSAQDLLTENEEKLVSVDKKMDEYLQNGGELTGTAPQVKSLEVNRSQKNGIVIMLVIGVAIAGMLTILAVQKYSRRRR